MRAAWGAWTAGEYPLAPCQALLEAAVRPRRSRACTGRWRARPARTRTACWRSSRPLAAWARSRPGCSSAWLQAPGPPLPRSSGTPAACALSQGPRPVSGAPPAPAQAHLGPCTCYRRVGRQFVPGIGRGDGLAASCGSAWLPALIPLRLGRLPGTQASCMLSQAPCLDSGAPSAPAIRRGSVRLQSLPGKGSGAGPAAGLQESLAAGAGPAAVVLV